MLYAIKNIYVKRFYIDDVFSFIYDYIVFGINFDTIVLHLKQMTIVWSTQM
jgi:hypothetical protein